MRKIRELGFFSCSSEKRFCVLGFLGYGEGREGKMSRTQIFNFGVLVTPSSEGKLANSLKKMFL